MRNNASITRATVAPPLWQLRSSLSFCYDVSQRAPRKRSRSDIRKKKKRDLGIRTG